MIYNFYPPDIPCAQPNKRPLVITFLPDYSVNDFTAIPFFSSEDMEEKVEIQPERIDLGEKISELIQNGIILTDDVLHYIDSTFLNPSIETLNRILVDPSNCEAETVAELIFFPDLNMQKKLESTLNKNYYNETDVESAISYLLQKKIAVAVTFPDNRGSLRIRMTDSTIRQFMARLKITKKMNVRLLETMSRVIPDKSENLQIRVMLRNCRIQFSDTVISFLCACIEKMYSASDFFAEAFAFLLNFFEYTEPGQDIYHHLMQEKKIILNSIEQAEKNEKAMAVNNIEILMLKGVHILTVDMADARKKMVLIDHICISMFGKTELFGHEGQSEPPVILKNFIRS